MKRDECWFISKKWFSLLIGKLLFDELFSGHSVFGENFHDIDSRLIPAHVQQHMDLLKAIHAFHQLSLRGEDLYEPDSITCNMEHVVGGVGIDVDDFFVLADTVKNVEKSGEVSVAVDGDTHRSLGGDGVPVFIPSDETVVLVGNGLQSDGLPTRM